MKKLEVGIIWVNVKYNYFKSYFFPSIVIEWNNFWHILENLYWLILIVPFIITVLGKFPPGNSHPENPHLEYSHPRFYFLCFFIIVTVIITYCCNELKSFVACRPLIYLKKWKQFLRIGSLCNIKVTEDTVRHNEKFSNLFSSKVLCL